MKVNCRKSRTHDYWNTMNTSDSSPSSSTSLKTKPQNPTLKNKTIWKKKTTQELNLENPYSKSGFNLIN